MGYSTDFVGSFDITCEVTDEMIECMYGIFGEDCRKHPEWKVFTNEELTWMNFELVGNNTAIAWDGSEKTYHFVEKTNLILDIMKDRFPQFGLSGKIMAYGEIPGDIWAIVIEEGRAVKKSVTVEVEK